MCVDESNSSIAALQSLLVTQQHKQINKQASKCAQVTNVRSSPQLAHPKNTNTSKPQGYKYAPLAALPTSSCSSPDEDGDDEDEDERRPRERKSRVRRWWNADMDDGTGIDSLSPMLRVAEEDVLRRRACERMSSVSSPPPWRKRAAADGACAAAACGNCWSNCSRLVMACLFCLLVFFCFGLVCLLKDSFVCVVCFFNERSHWLKYWEQIYRNCVLNFRIEMAHDVVTQPRSVPTHAL